MQYRLLCANITVWGPSAAAFLRKAAEQKEYQGMMLVETHAADTSDMTAELMEWGFQGISGQSKTDGQVSIWHRGRCGRCAGEALCDDSF